MTATRVHGDEATFSRAEWSTLRAATPLVLDEDDLTQLRGLNERLQLDEVAEIYLPLSRLLHLRVEATRALHEATGTFLGRRLDGIPFVLAVAGSVAVGKSTTARLLQALLARWPEGRRVDLVTTDGFLLPNAELESRGIMHRKGFPESYDLRALVRFLAEVKAGEPRVAAPVYSHLVYDRLPDRSQVVDQPDILILEGLNVLQTPRPDAGDLPVFVSDFFDFSIYLDADVQLLRRWYVERFLALRDTAFKDPVSYFHRYTGLSPSEAVTTARDIWHEINERNLVENIAPTRTRANLVLEKGEDHAVQRVRLRRL